MDRQPSAAKGIEVVNRVLVVDDDQDLRKLLQMVLDDGMAASEFLTRAEGTWIVLLDVMLPRLSGLEVCSDLRAAGPAAARHRVALMTAGRLEEKDCPPPARTLLRKPFRLETMRNLVAALAHDQAEYGSELSN